MYKYKSQSLHYLFLPSVNSISVYFISLKPNVMVQSIKNDCTTRPSIFNSYTHA